MPHISVWLTERRHNPDFAEGYDRGICDSLYWSIVTVSTVGYGNEVAHSNAGRMLALIWIATRTLVFATFTAAIASAVAVEEAMGGIGGPGELPGNRVATVPGSAGQICLAGIGIGPVLVNEIEEAYLVLNEGDVDTVVSDAPVLHFHATWEGQGTVTTVGPAYDDVEYGIVLGQDDPIFGREATSPPRDHRERSL